MSKSEDLVNKAINLYYSGFYEKSAKIYNKLISDKNPDNVNKILYYNLGLCNYSLNKFQAAEKQFKKSINLGGDCGYEVFLSTINQLNIEESKKWWIHRSTGSRKSYPDLPIKRADISDIKNKKLLVLNEQGFGDEFLFSRVISYLSSECESVSYQVYPETIDLFKNNIQYQNVNFFSDRSLNYDFVVSHDVFCLSGDYFFILLDEDYRIFNNQNNKTFDVGLCWQANALSPNSNDRSIYIEKILPLLKDKKTVSLQKNVECSEIESSNLDTFSDTHDLINKCNHIWTVDTSVAHLAICSGANVTLLYKDYLDWRWKLPVYPEKTFELLKIK